MHVVVTSSREVPELLGAYADHPEDDDPVCGHLDPAHLLQGRHRRPLTDTRHVNLRRLRRYYINFIFYSANIIYPKHSG